MVFFCLPRSRFLSPTRLGGDPPRTQFRGLDSFFFSLRTLGVGTPQKTSGTFSPPLGRVWKLLVSSSRWACQAPPRVKFCAPTLFLPLALRGAFFFHPALTGRLLFLVWVRPATPACLFFFSGSSPPNARIKFPLFPPPRSRPMMVTFWALGVILFPAGVVFDGPRLVFSPFRSRASAAGFFVAVQAPHSADYF